MTTFWRYLRSTAPHQSPKTHTVHSYCLHFDTNTKSNEEANNYYGTISNSSCEGYLDIGHDTWLNLNATNDAIDEWKSEWENDNLYEAESPMFPENLSTASRWLLSLCLSYFISLVAFGPIVLGAEQFWILCVFNPAKVDEGFYFEKDYHFLSEKEFERLTE